MAPLDAKSQPSPAVRGRLKMRQLLLLVRLDEQRSVLRAAEAANMTQPGASKLLKELEDSLGVPLFERHARGVVPTWYGEIMVRRARSALADMEHAHDEIAALQAGFTGQATVGAIVDPGTTLVPLAIAMLKQRHPKILVKIEIDDSATLIRRLQSGDLDIVVARISRGHGEGDLLFETLAGESHSVVARSAHPLVRKRGLTLKDLVDQPWVLPPRGRSLLRDRLDSLFLQEGLRPPQNVVETASLPVITSLLQTSDSMAALQERTVRPYLDAGLLTVLPIAIGVKMAPFGIVTRREHRLPPGGEAMLQSLRVAAKTIYTGARRNPTPAAKRQRGRHPDA